MPEEEQKQEQPAPSEEKVEEKTKEKEEKKKKKERKGKSPHKNKPTSKRWEKYKIEGEKLVRKKFCPRCGPGIFLMKAKDRLYCGKCHYTEFLGKEEIEKTKNKEK
jgi:small subunit ribosomal protein S27Ae